MTRVMMWKLCVGFAGLERAKLPPLKCAIVSFNDLVCLCSSMRSREHQTVTAAAVDMGVSINRSVLYTPAYLS